MSEDHVTIFYWSQETALVPFVTGIQRVVRRTQVELSRLPDVQIVPVGWNERSRQVETLPARESRGGRLLDSVHAERAVLFVPEIPLSLIGTGLDPLQLGRAYGLRTAAVVHDLIPLKLASDYASETVAHYRSYYRRLSSADLMVATTNYVASQLRDFLLEERLSVPPIEVINLPAEFADVPRQQGLPPRRGRSDPLKLLAITTWEPRKNIVRLLEAIEQISADGEVDISVDLVGRRGAFPIYDEAVLSIARSLPSVAIRGTVSDAELVALYAGCHASIYPSLEEGFGLPILESLWLGRPCLCHNGSSMAEIAPGGGALLVDMSDRDGIVRALRQLAVDPECLERLAREAIDRPLRTWTAFAEALRQRLAFLC